MNVVIAFSLEKFIMQRFHRRGSDIKSPRHLARVVSCSIMTDNVKEHVRHSSRPMNLEPTKPILNEQLAETAVSSADNKEDMALENQAELKRLIEETCKSISSSKDLIEQIKQDRGV